MKSPDKFTLRLTELLEKGLGAEKLNVDRTFLVGYLFKALENQGYVKLKKIGSAKVYFNKWG